MLLTSWLLSVLLAGPVSVRCHPAPEAPSNSIGLEAIIRKALMGNFDEQSEERAPASQAGGAGVPAGAAMDARADDFFSQGALRSRPVLSDSPSPQASPSGLLRVPCVSAGGGKSSKSGGGSNGRKAKSPGPGLSGGERPSSVSSVHSEGDCNRRTPLTNRVWEDRPSSTGLPSPSALVRSFLPAAPLKRFCLRTGSTPTPFPCNPLVMRFPSGTMSAPSPSSAQPGVQGPVPGQGRSWEEGPKPLLMSQYETLSDSE